MVLLIAFGLGGIHVELFRDVAFRIAPLTDRDADELIRSVRGFELLQGYRNQPPADIRALRDVLLRYSYLGGNPGAARAGIQSRDGAAGRPRAIRIVDVRAKVGPGFGVTGTSCSAFRSMSSCLRARRHQSSEPVTKWDPFENVSLGAARDASCLMPTASSDVEQE